MAKRTALVVIDGRLQPLPSGDRLQDAGGNEVANMDIMSLKGTIDASGNPNYPAAENGDMYIIDVAGRVGGASGKIVEAGDSIICMLDGTASGDEAAVGSYWVVLNQNVTDTSAAIRKAYTFNYDVVMDGVNQLTAATVMDFVAPLDSFVVSATVKMKSARTAGSIELKPHINGTIIASSAIILEINEINTTKDYSVIAWGDSDYELSAGDTFGFICTSTSFGPLDNVMSLGIVIEG